MAIALDTPTISFSSLAFSFETPGEMSTPVGEGHEPRIVGIDVRAEREDDYGATMSIEAGGEIFETELHADGFIWFYMLKLFGINDEHGIADVDYHEGTLVLVDNSTDLM